MVAYLTNSMLLFYSTATNLLETQNEIRLDISSK